MFAFTFLRQRIREIFPNSDLSFLPRLNPTFSHSHTDVTELLSLSSVPNILESHATVDLNSGFRLEGNTFLQWYRRVTDPTILLRELSRWFVDIDIKELMSGNLKGAFKIDRYPTIRESIHYILSLFLKKLSPVFSALSFLWKNKMKILLFSLWVLIIRLLILIATGRPYRKALPNIDPAHRPPAIGNLVALQGGAGQPAQLLQAYPPQNQEEARKVLFDRENLLDRMAGAPQEECSVCKCRLVNCQCQPQGERMQVIISKYAGQVIEKNRRLNQLLVDDRLQQFQLGQIFDMKIDTNLLAKMSEFCGLQPYVLWKMEDSFDVNDTRSTTEKHIQIGNTRFWIIRQKKIRIVVQIFGTGRIFILPKWCFWLFQMPNRDLVIAEDFFRLNRRSSIDAIDKFSASLRGQLDTMLSVPINDPSFVHLGAHPLRDGYFVVRAFLERKVLPYEAF